MLSQNRNFTWDYFLESFLSGLKDEIANSLYINKPTTLRDAINQARGHEIYLESLDMRHQPTARSVTGNTHTYKPTPPATKEQQNTNKPGSKPKVYPIKRLTVAEMMTRRKKGLC